MRAIRIYFTYLMTDSFLVKKRRRLYIIGLDAPHIKRFLNKIKTGHDQLEKTENPE